MKIVPKKAGGKFIVAFSAFLLAGFLQDGISDVVVAAIVVYGFINLVMSVVQYVRKAFGSAHKEAEKPLEVNVNVRIVEIKRETKQ